MLVCIASDIYKIARKLKDVGFDSIEIVSEGCGEDYCDTQAKYVFEVDTARFEEFTLKLLEYGHILRHESFEAIVVKWDNCTSYQRIHPQAIRQYVEDLVAGRNEVEVFVNDDLYLSKSVKANLIWHEG